MYVCPKCGYHIENDNAIFCPNCEEMVHPAAKAFMALEEEKADPQLARERREARERRFSNENEEYDDYVHTPLNKDKESHIGLIVVAVLIVAAVVCYSVFFK